MKKKHRIDHRFKTEYEKWCLLPDLTEEERKLLVSMTEEEQQECFYRQVPFGTAGMRGKVGLGSNRINRYTIRLAAWGMAQILGEGKKVAIAYDTRLDSKNFAEEAAKVLAEAGLKVLIFDRYSPVPLLSYTVRELHCDGGIVITASHNTKAYNGFKTYEASGAQMGPNKTEEIFRWMLKKADPLDVPHCDDLTQENIEWIGEEIAERFTSAAADCSKLNDSSAKKDLSIVYTPLFGSGRDFVLDALEKDGFSQVHLVKKQAGFDGKFPGLRKPNPEEPEVFRIAEREALQEHADLMIATDPDSDRIGAGVIQDSKAFFFTGNQIGALLADFFSRQGSVKGKIMVTTVVTGDLGSRIVTSRGATVILCETAAWHKTQGKTLLDALEDLYQEYGYYIDEQDSFVFEGAKGAKEMQKIMARLRSRRGSVFAPLGKPDKILDYEKGVDELPRSNVLKFFFPNGSWVAVRPSGTEPKIKFYYCIRGKDQRQAEDLYEAVQASVEEFLRTF